MKSPLTTLCYIRNEDSYLLLHRIKKENDINKDKWIGVGGHFEESESPEECLLREVKEETGLTLTSYKFHGIVTFVSDNDPVEYMCLYSADSFTGEIIECNEGKLEWIKKSDYLSLNLWEGDPIFINLMESGHPFFSLKLVYKSGKLIHKYLDGKEFL